MKTICRKISLLLFLGVTVLFADNAPVQSTQVHPFERENGYFFSQFNTVNKAFFTYSRMIKMH